MPIAPPSSNALVLAGMFAGGAASTAYAALAWHARVRAADRAARWPIAVGEIVDTWIVVHEDSDGDEYEPRVLYRYRTHGQAFEGERLRVGARRIKVNDQAAAKAVIAPYHAGMRVQVHYDPDKPSRSVLEAKPTGSGLEGWLVMGLFLLAAATYIAITLIWPQNQGDPSIP